MEAMVRDFLEYLKKEPSLSLKIAATDIGLEHIEAIASPVGFSNKSQLIKRFPESRHLLENSETAIAETMAVGDFTTLGAVSDVIVDEGFLRDLTKALGSTPSTPAQIDLVKTLWNSPHNTVTQAIMKNTFSGPAAVDMKEIFVKVIAKGDQKQMADLARYAFKGTRSVRFNSRSRCLPS